MNNQTSNDYIKAGAELSTQEELKKLAGSKQMLVRRHVAENPRTDVETLRDLSNDERSSVRMAVALNKITPPDLLRKLADDESPDLRYRIAATSYMPRDLLELLAKDRNPYVCHRAKLTIDAMSPNKQTERIALFELLQEDHRLLLSDLDSLIDDFPDLSMGEAFDRAVEVLDEFRRHLSRQESWCKELLASAGTTQAAKCLQKCRKDSKQLKASISHILMQHVDGPDFHRSLGKLRRQLLAHTEYAEKELFVKMTECIPDEDLLAVGKQVRQSLLRGLKNQNSLLV